MAVEGDAVLQLDLAVLQTLREALGDDSLLAEVVATFLEETPDQLAALSAAISVGDEAAAAAAAHVITGSAVTLGAVALGRTCTALQRSPSPALADEAVQEFAAVSRLLSEYAAAL